MKFSLASMAYFAAAVGAGQPAILTINTPYISRVSPLTSLSMFHFIAVALIFCDTFAGVVPGADPTEAPIELLGKQTGDALTWVVNIAAGTWIGFTLKDSLGDLAQTVPVTVEPGASTACLAARIRAGSGFF